jgi:hypothetical protein
MNLALARSIVLVPLAALAVACSAAPTDETAAPADPASDDVAVSVDDRGVETRLFNGGGTGGGSTLCEVTCPFGKLDGCYLPCIDSGGAKDKCATNCGCTRTGCSLKLR